jgi:uncharacterized protein (UPF0128 family)
MNETRKVLSLHIGRWGFDLILRVCRGSAAYMENGKDRDRISGRDESAEGHALQKGEGIGEPPESG